MVLKKYLVAEAPYDGETFDVERLKENLQIAVLSSYISEIFPDDFIEELRKFSKKNAILHEYSIHGNKKKSSVCCTRCLKAHALNICKRENLREAEKIIEGAFEVEAGHNGYYLDSEKVVKIN